jgi:hypothetical protein
LHTRSNGLHRFPVVGFITLLQTLQLVALLALLLFQGSPEGPPEISMTRLSTRVQPNRAAKPPCLDGPHLKNPKPAQLSVENHRFPPVDNFIHSREIAENWSFDPNYPQA